MHSINIPKTMMAVRQDKAGGPLYLSEIPVPVPKANEVLIKISASPINPSDLSMIQGTYADKPSFPITPGLEGSGVVVAAGKGLLPKLRLGKRVTCTSSGGGNGIWAEYMITSAKRCIPLSKNINQEEGAMLIVNPMTALAFIEIAKNGKHKAIVNNAAASALGQMLIRLCKKHNIPLINIVRNQAQYDLLINVGAEHIINSESPDFESKLKEKTHLLNTTLLLDAVDVSTCVNVSNLYFPVFSSVSIFSNGTTSPKAALIIVTLAPYLFNNSAY
ncbi:alcohol dehydrogenase catalytic domain-containing protein, partial [Bacteroidota bacterium]